MEARPVTDFDVFEAIIKMEHWGKVVTVPKIMEELNMDPKLNDPKEFTKLVKSLVKAELIEMNTKKEYRTLPTIRRSLVLDDLGFQE